MESSHIKIQVKMENPMVVVDLPVIILSAILSSFALTMVSDTNVGIK